MNILPELFESDLIKELAAYPVQKFAAGTVLIEEFCSVESIPLLLKGKIEVSQTNFLQKQTHVYDIVPVESCILSLAGAQNNKKSVGNGTVKEDSEIILIPAPVTKEWYNRYSTWRDFVSGLYNKRLNELIHQRNLVQEQALEIERQKNEITESIRYASRIQKTVLQTSSAFKAMVADSFVLYQPKDIVSGDFFWSFQCAHTVFFAVADCTGHGVPGAMLSVVCYKALDEVVRGGADQPVGVLLDLVSAKIQAVFETEEMSLSDGMDISLCAFDLEKRSLTFSGANNGIYLVKASKEVEEYRANRQPIGKSEIKIPFETNEIAVASGDALYLTSDGYQDQFGGPNDKKVRKKQLKELLQQVHGQTPADKKAFLLDFFNTWKGANEQVDDVCLIGIDIR